MIKNFNPAIFGKLNAFRPAAGKHRPSSLQMGFRTLTIQKRSSEVWNLLAAVKTEWTRYGDILDAVQKKLNQASETIDKAKIRSRAIGRKLRDVQELPKGAATTALLESTIDEYGEENDDMALDRLGDAGMSSLENQ